MAAGKALVRIFSYVFHGLLALFLLAISAITLAGGAHNLRMAMLPWTGSALTWWLFSGALAGLISLILALKDVLRVLFLIWSVAVLGFVVRGYFMAPYHFSGPAEFKQAIYLAGGAIVAVFGAWFQFRRERGRR